MTGRFGESLDRLKDRLADPVGDRVVEGLRVAREVGGGELGRLLRNLSGYLREDVRTRSRARVAAGLDRQRRPARGRGAVAGAAVHVVPDRGDPPLRLARPASLVLAVGAGLCLVAYRLMMRIGRLPVERRILS